MPAAPVPPPGRETPDFPSLPPTVSADNPLARFLTRQLGDPPPAVEAWWSQAQPRDLPRGRMLQQAGQPWRHLWWVERGALRLYLTDRDGAESNKNFFLDEAMFWPVTPSLLQSPSMFHVEPLEDSRVWALPMPAPGTPAPTDGWEPWRLLEHRTLCLLLDHKMQREQEFLQLNARERYARLLERHPHWPARIPLRHLASYLGITDVTLSRLRSEMGLIRG